MNVFDAFRRAGTLMADDTRSYMALHREYGLSKEDWDLVTQSEPWNTEQRMRVRSVLAECCQISLTIAGLPANSLPAQFVAAMIAAIVSPCNLLVAATRAPESFDAVASANTQKVFELTPVLREQMISLCMLYIGDWRSEPMATATGNVELIEETPEHV